MKLPAHRLLAFILVAVITGPGLAAGTDDNLIVPGVRVGAIELGKPIPATFRKALGKPTSHQPATPGPNGRDSGSSYWAGKLNIKLNDGQRDDHVFSVFLEPGSARYKTAKGIGVGASAAAVTRAYPGGKKTDAMDVDYGWSLPGIEFYIVDQKVSGIGVFPKGVR